MPKPRKFAVAVMLVFTIATASTPDGAAWRQDDAPYAHTISA